MSDFSPGDKVEFTDQKVRLSTRSCSVSYKTVRGTIQSISEKKVATIAVGRGKTRTCHINNLTRSVQDQPSALGKAFMHALTEAKQIAKECDQEA